MHILRQTICQITQEICHPRIRQQMKIINENIIHGTSPQCITDSIYEESRRCHIIRAFTSIQKIQSRKCKGLLYTFPENRQIIRINADAYLHHLFCLQLSAQIPVHCCGFPITHRRSYCSQRTLRNRAQTFLQTLRYVDCVQMISPFWHFRHSFSRSKSDWCFFSNLIFALIFLLYFVCIILP